MFFECSKHSAKSYPKFPLEIMSHTTRKDVAFSVCVCVCVCVCECVCVCVCVSFIGSLSALFLSFPKAKI